MIPGYPQGSDITILETYYQRVMKIVLDDEDNSKWVNDKLTIIFKDNVTNKKKYHTIEKPDYEYFVANDNVYLDHNLFFIDKEDVHSVKVPYVDLEKSIAEETNNLDFYYTNIKNGNRIANKQLHTIEKIFNSDMDIEDHYRYRFDKTYKNSIINISKSYFDIEVDTINMKGDFPELGECPINAVSFIDDNTKSINVFLLRNDKNPLIQEFENSISPELFAELKAFVIDTVGGQAMAEKYKIADFSFNFNFYDEEIALIQDLFITINKCSPDFLLAWNMAFDIPYIIERIKRLGYNPEDIMCHPDFEDKIVSYFIDERHRNEYELRGDRYIISSYTVFLDQLIHFASRRKGQAAFPDFKLDTAGEIIANVKKLDYSHITTNISKLPYLNYKIFVFYNIIDTVVQKCIEEKVSDINYIFNKCLVNNTRYTKGHRQTIYLTNRATKEFELDGYIIGNNNNRNNEASKYEGALVGDPEHVSDYCKLKQDGQVLNIADNLDDFDYKSLYPSIDREGNMAPNTQVGKVIISEHINDYENMSHSEFYERSGQFMDDFTSGDVLTFCSRWLGLMTYSQWIKYLISYMKCNMVPVHEPVTDRFVHPIAYNNTNMLNPAIYYQSEDELETIVIQYPDPIDYKYYLKTNGFR